MVRLVLEQNRPVICQSEARTNGAPTERPDLRDGHLTSRFDRERETATVCRIIGVALGTSDRDGAIAHVDASTRRCIRNSGQTAVATQLEVHWKVPLRPRSYGCFGVEGKVGTPTLAAHVNVVDLRVDSVVPLVSASSDLIGSAR